MAQNSNTPHNLGQELSKEEGIPPVNRTKEVAKFKDVKAKGHAIANNLTEHEPPSRSPFVPNGPFSFVNLPAELRHSVLRWLLPTGLIIHLDDGMSPSYTKSIMSRGRESQVVTGIGQHQPNLQFHLSHWQTSLFSINTFLANEAKGIFYGQNTFSFIIDAHSHKPISFRSLQIFGQLGNENSLPLLRELKDIQLIVDFDGTSLWATKRHRARLAFFVEVLKKHSDNSNQKSLLKRLRVVFRLTTSIYSIDHVMFGLESLANLRGIQDVTVTGQELPTWYTAALELCIRGAGGEVQELSYPEIPYKRWIGYSMAGRKPKYKEGIRSLKKWYEPNLDWENFTERNGIEGYHAWKANILK